MSYKQDNSRELACRYRNANCRYTHAHGIANRYASAHSTPPTTAPELTTTPLIAAPELTVTPDSACGICQYLTLYRSRVIRNCEPLSLIVSATKTSMYGLIS